MYESQLIDGYSEPTFFNEAYFCGMNYAYITDNYLYYIETKGENGTGVASTLDPFFLTIGEFGDTVLNYGFDNPETPENDMIIFIDNYNGISTWKDYIQVMSVIHDICPPKPLIPEVNIPIPEQADPCEALLNNITAAYAQESYLNYLETIRNEFEEGYINGAIANAVEQSSMTYPDKEYQYTLYYYDQAGNLIQTVSPEGVDRLGDGLTAGDKETINATVNNDVANNTNNAALPQHNLKTQYKYNSLNQLVWQKTPDGGITRFAYDDLGRIIASQNDKQNPMFSGLRYIENIPNTFIFSEDGKTIRTLNNSYREAYGVDILEGDGYLEHTITDDAFAHHAIGFGLTYAQQDVNNTNFNNINYHIFTQYFSQTGLLNAMRMGDGVNSSYNWISSSLRNLVVGDVLKIERLNNQISYYKNEILLGSFPETNPGEPMRIDMRAHKFKIIADIKLVNYNNSSKPTETFSYTVYDELGRIVEAGEVQPPNNNYIINDEGRLVNTTNNTLVNGFENHVKNEVTKTYYDTAISLPSSFASDYQSSSQLFNNYNPLTARNRVSAILYFDTLNPLTAQAISFDNGIFYNYDIHGNVKELVNFYSDLTGENNYNMHLKRVAYEYDLISGNVKKVIFQNEKPDQFIHRYSYDADNRITQVETSRDNVVWERDANYQYYKHGPLARTTVGDKEVQGLDYVYTLQGWLKAVNGEYIGNPDDDFGGDGKTGTSNALTAKDAFGYSLQYFNNDYKNVANNSSNYFEYSNSNPYNNNLYNGNIKQMVTSIRTAEDQILPT